MTIVKLPPVDSVEAQSSHSLNAVKPVSTTLHDPSTLLDELERQQQLRTESDAEFDPINFFNQHFTSETTLVKHLPGLRQAIVERMHTLDDRIATSLQRQSETAVHTRQQVQQAKASVAELVQRVRLVQEKASQSEAKVLEITRDMKRLDCAKNHLQKTITTLKRLHMLIHAVEQLRHAVAIKPYPDYKTASHLVEAIRLLLTHFESFHRVKQILMLRQNVTSLQEDMRMRLVRGFRIQAFGVEKTIELESKSIGEKLVDESYSDSDYPHMKQEVLEGGVLLIDALGEDVRRSFIHNFCQDFLYDYSRKFDPPQKEVKPEKRVSSFKAVEPKAELEKPVSSLDQVEKRFIWFRNVLDNVEKKFHKVFPTHWNFQAQLSYYFLTMTKSHFIALLNGPRKDADANVANILLKALQKTNIFEKEITAWLQHEYGTTFSNASEQTTKEQNLPSSEIFNPLIGISSSAFEDYMGPYIELEEQSMAEQLVEALEDRTVDTRGARPVFISSTNLFVYIKGSITRCTALSKGKAFYQLFQAFQDSLRKYSQILSGKLPPAVPLSTTITGTLTLGGPFASQKQDISQAQYRVAKGEEVTVCHIISTCEYCVDTMEALEDLIRDTIDDEYKPKIDMLNDQEGFHDTTAKAIRVLVSGLTNRTENAFKSLSSTNWSSWEAVGEESTYVRWMHEEIEPYVTVLRKLLPTSYFRSFCDKFAVVFSTTYFDSLVRLKRISEPGTQQLLLDVYNLKTLFLKLPVLEVATTTTGKATVSGTSTIAPAVYTKMIQKQFGKIETLLKLVGTPVELLIENFKVQWPDGSTSDLQTVLSLKGLKRNEQGIILEQYGVDALATIKGTAAAIAGATTVSERVQALQDQGSNVAAKVNSDLNQMRLKVDEFRKSFK